MAMMKRVQFVPVVVVCALFYIKFSLAAILQEKFAWKEVDYAWESESQKEEAVTNGRYIVENNLPLGLDVWRDKLFITVPRQVIYFLLLCDLKLYNDGISKCC